MPHLATLFRSAFGFGEALVAMPLLALLIPVEEAVPWATLVSITVGAVVVAQDCHKIHVRSAGWLVISILFGIPLDLWLLTAVAETVVKAILAVVTIGFSLYCLISRRQYELKNDRLAWLFGFGTGVLGGVYGMNGPPLVIDSEDDYRLPIGRVDHGQRQSFDAVCPREEGLSWSDSARIESP
jgi:uncharacterized membrane protein YfcA